MPIKMYSFKEGSRSTPKLRRNQSSWKYKENPSVDSFTSLRPSSPGLAQTLPGSPADLGIPTSPLLWQEYSSTRPVHMSNEAEPSLPSPPLMSPPNFSPATGTYNAPGRTDAMRTFTTVSTTALDGFKSDPIVAERNHGAHIISLGLLPNQVGLVRSEGHASNIVQIYDWQGNEISYTFNTMEEFEAEHEFDVDRAVSAKGPWRRLKKWRTEVKKKWKVKTGQLQSDQVEIWHRKRW